MNPRALTLAACLLVAGCARPQPPGSAAEAAAVACGTLDSPGGVPQAHTVYANGRVVRWNGRSATTGGAVLGRARSGARDTLWAALGQGALEAGVVAGPHAFVEVTGAQGTRRVSRPLRAHGEDAFHAVFAACREAVASAEPQ